jgi:flagellar hook-length control protein FliK
MSAAGALALAGTLSPAASGALPPAGASGDPAARPFEGLLAEADGASAETVANDPIAAPQDPAATPFTPTATPVDPTPTALPTASAPPPMDDPATTAVLNALALRVANDQRLANAAGSAAAGGVAAGAAAAAANPLDGAPPLNAAALAQAALPAAPAPTPAAMLSAAAASAAAIALPGVVRGPANHPTGAVSLPGFSTPAEGDAESLDALLSSLDALLPATPAKRAAPAATAPATAATAPQSPPVAPLATLPTALPTDIARSALDAALDPTHREATGEGGALPTTSLTATPPAAQAVPFAVAPGAAAASTGAAARADGAMPPIQVPFDSPQWGNELATRVVSLAREQFGEAEIRVTPDELGPIEVKLRFEGDRVHAQFGAISPEAREALTANLHRLREMFAGEGLNLGQAFVGHHGQDSARRFDGQGTRSGGTGVEGDDDATLPVARTTIAARRGLLDEFA